MVRNTQHAKVMENKYTQTHLLSLVGKTLAEMQGTDVVFLAELGQSDGKRDGTAVSWPDGRMADGHANRCVF